MTESSAGQTNREASAARSEGENFFRRERGPLIALALLAVTVWSWSTRAWHLYVDAETGELVTEKSIVGIRYGREVEPLILQPNPDHKDIFLTRIDYGIFTKARGCSPSNGDIVHAAELAERVAEKDDWPEGLRKQVSDALWTAHDADQREWLRDFQAVVTDGVPAVKAVIDRRPD